MQPTRCARSHGRWHFQHGPIDLLVRADGDAAAVAAAHEAAWARFAGVLPELVAELPLLRQPVDKRSAVTDCPLRGAVAQRMWRACHPLRSVFITPMAAVAGAVAEEIIAVYHRHGVQRAWVNNGGDIALHLQPGAALTVGLFADLARWQPQAAALPLDGRFQITADSTVRGVATSGWRGRSFSLGIADSVTVLAATAAQADAAATVLANAVNADDARIVRRPASALKDDSDLGDLAVTVDVPQLPPALVVQALQHGACSARALQALGLIDAAVLVCQGQAATVAPRWPQRMPQQTRPPALVQRHFGSALARLRFA